MTDPTETARLIRAPWTTEQVAALNAFQERGGMHPFTCGREAHGVRLVLLAHRDGWHCSDPACDYRQDWAHAFMADPNRWPAAAGVAPAADRPLAIPDHTVNEEQGPEDEPAATPAVDRAALREAVAALLRPHANLGGTPPRYELPLFDGATPSLPRISGWWTLDDVVDAVMAVLPDTSRAATLREAADGFDRHATQILEGAGDKAVFVAKALRDQAAVWSEAAETLRRLADEAQQQPEVVRCRCPHPADEHSVYGCVDGCACEWMPKRKPMDPVHILGIYADPTSEQESAAADTGEEA